MTRNETTGGFAITEADVSTLARVAGLTIAPGDLPVVASRLADLYVLAADLDRLDLDGVEPSVRYDPRWPEETES